MSASRNPDGPGVGTEFHSKIERDEPMQTGGHKPGKMVGNDVVPEFEVETLPAGSAPPSKTFEPNTSATDKSSEDPAPTPTSNLVDDVLASVQPATDQSNVARGSSEAESLPTTTTTSSPPELKQSDAISADNSTRSGTSEAFGVSQPPATSEATSSLPASKQDNILSATDATRPGAKDAGPVGVSQAQSDSSLSDNIKNSLDQLSAAAPPSQSIVPQSIAEKLPTTSQAADAVKQAAASLISGVQSLALGARDDVAKSESPSQVEDSDARKVDDLHAPGEYNSQTAEAKDRTTTQGGLDSIQDMISPSADHVQQSMQSAKDALPSTGDVKSSLQAASTSAPSTEDIKSSLQSAQSTLPSPQDALNSAKEALPDGNVTKSKLPSPEAVKSSLPDVASKQASAIGSNISEQVQGAAASVQNQTDQAVEYVKAQLPGQQSTPKSEQTGTELIQDQHTTDYGSTSQLDGNISLEPSGVPQVVTDSQRLALASPEATANPEAVQEKQEVERELKQAVRPQPATEETEVEQDYEQALPKQSTVTSSSSAPGGAEPGTLALAGGAITGAATFIREKAQEATGTDPVSVLPESAQRAIDGEVSSRGTSGDKQILSESLASGVSATGDTVKGAASSANDAVSSNASSARETIADVVSSASTTAASAASSASNTVMGAASYTRENAQQSTGASPVSALPPSTQETIASAVPAAHSRNTLDPQAVLSTPAYQRAAEKVPTTDPGHSETLDSSFPSVVGAGDLPKSSLLQGTAAPDQAESRDATVPQVTGAGGNSLNDPMASFGSETTIPRVLRSEPPSGADLQPGIRLAGVSDPSVGSDALPEPGMAVKTVSHIPELRTADVSISAREDDIGNDS